MHYSYSIYGLSIQSFLSLTGLNKSIAQPDVVIERAKVHPPKKFLKQKGRSHVTKQGVYLYYPDICSFFINKKEIQVDIVEHADIEVIKQYILNHALSVLFHLRGYLILHGSSIAFNDNAFVFLGDSGTGKSTIATMMHSLGYEFITDDHVVLKQDRALWWVMPGAPSGKLWPDVLDFLDGKAVNFSKEPPLTIKQKKRLHMKPVTAPVALKKIYVLTNGPKNSIAVLPPQDKVIQLIKHTFIANLLHEKTIQEHFLQCADLEKQIEIFHLQRVRSLQLLPNLGNLIDEDIKRCVLIKN